MNAQGGTTQRLNHSLNGRTIAVRNAGGINSLTYLHGDHLGSVNVMTDASGTILNNSITKYDPFGAYRDQRPDTENPTEMGFTGHYHNDEIDLIYMNARFYVPEIGRFAAPDSFVPNPANPQSLNRYSYVNNNALNFTDPSGNCGVRVWFFGYVYDTPYFSPPPVAPNFRGGLKTTQELATDLVNLVSHQIHLFAPRVERAFEGISSEVTSLVQRRPSREREPAPVPQIDIFPNPDDDGRIYLYHYTNAVGYKDILQSRQIEFTLYDEPMWQGANFTDISPQEVQALPDGRSDLAFHLWLAEDARAIAKTEYWVRVGFYPWEVFPVTDYDDPRKLDHRLRYNEPSLWRFLGDEKTQTI